MSTGLNSKQLTANAMLTFAEFYRLATSAFFFEFRSSDMNLSDIQALILIETLGPISPSILAEHLSITGASTTSLIDRLEKKNLVKRVRSLKDRRQVQVHPVRRSKKSEIANIYSEVLSKKSVAELKILTSTMGDIVHALVNRTKDKG